MLFLKKRMMNLLISKQLMDNLVLCVDGSRDNEKIAATSIHYKKSF